MPIPVRAVCLREYRSRRGFDVTLRSRSRHAAPPYLEADGPPAAEQRVPTSASKRWRRAVRTEIRHARQPPAAADPRLRRRHGGDVRRRHRGRRWLPAAAIGPRGQRRRQGRCILRSRRWPPATSTSTSRRSGRTLSRLAANPQISGLFGSTPPALHPRLLGIRRLHHRPPRHHRRRRQRRLLVARRSRHRRLPRPGLDRRPRSTGRRSPHPWSTAARAGRSSSSPPRSRDTGWPPPSSTSTRSDRASLSTFGGPRGLEFLVATGDGQRAVTRSIDPERWVGTPLIGHAVRRLPAGSAPPGRRGQVALLRLGTGRGHRLAGVCRGRPQPGVGGGPRAEPRAIWRGVVLLAGRDRDRVRARPGGSPRRSSP